MCNSPSNNAMQLTGRPVTRLAGSAPPHISSKGGGQGARPSRPAADRGRWTGTKLQDDSATFSMNPNRYSSARCHITRTTATNPRPASPTPYQDAAVESWESLQSTRTSVSSAKESMRTTSHMELVFLLRRPVPSNNAVKLSVRAARPLLSRLRPASPLKVARKGRATRPAAYRERWTVTI